MTIMNDETREFVAMHRDEDVRELALKAKRVEGLDLSLALDQIAGWQIASKKLPQWASCEGIIYPPHISMEQCSSQFTAQYKSEIAQTLLASAATVRANVSDSAESDTLVAKRAMVDLTGGFGVDFSYLARGFSQSTYVERQRHLCDLAEHNMAALGLDQARIVCGDGVEYLRQMDPVDFIYLDPARRDEHGARTYAICILWPPATNARNCCWYWDGRRRRMRSTAWMARVRTGVLRRTHAWGRWICGQDGRTTTRRR